MTDPDRRLSERLHGIADHSMAVTIGNMVQEMITELKKRESPGYPGHISFTLTDEERAAVRFCTTAALPETEKLGGVAGELCRMHAATLRALLERL